MNQHIVALEDIDRTCVAIVGGKGANLAELSKIEGISVPKGICITTAAYADVVGDNHEFKALVDRLVKLQAVDHAPIKETAERIRRVIGNSAVPETLKRSIAKYIRRFGETHGYAVRSSATSEDLPGASFAGQHDTYLNIVGTDNIVKHITKCWASLFAERAVMYRLKNGFDHRKVLISVVLQRMIHADVSGVMFTADPVSGNRKVISIDSSFGLGEALVSGVVNSDLYKIRNDIIVEKKIGTKKVIITSNAGGGTKREDISMGSQADKQALDDNLILRLSTIGRKIEKHFGSPQDIEWCLADQEFHIVQARPITHLFPVPESPDTKNRVYISVGHQQMMTDVIKPLGLSLWQLTSFAPMYKAGGRLFVDITERLSSVDSRNTLLNAMAQHDPLIRDAIDTLIARGDFITSPTENGEYSPKFGSHSSNAPIENDPSIIDDLIKASQESLEILRRNIHTKSGGELVDFIREDIQVHFRKSLFDPKSISVIMAGINASAWINEKINEWLGEKNVADTLSRSAPGNITSEMGLDLLDVADIIRPYPDVINFLEETQSESFLNDLPGVEGGREVQLAITKYLEKYGMRCAGEIDITRTRWSEKPTILIPILLSHIKTFKPGESVRRFQQGQKEALEKETEILTRLRQLPEGDQKANEAKQKIDLIRNFSGYREYPKYSIVSRYFVYKQALLKEAERSLKNLQLQDKTDIFYLTIDEFGEAIRTKKLDRQVIKNRKEEYEQYRKMSPPRVITSDGEIIVGKYKGKNFPEDAIVGLAVSAGVVEGRARVLTSMENADIEDGDILVTRFTDPSWTPLFVTIKGLVTEVGGLMTHGAVIAREYGLPAVVGVEHATDYIRDGQRIRVDGTNGWVQVVANGV